MVAWWFDIYVERDENGNWVNLKSLNINTKGNEKSPFLHVDNETLYFSSDTFGFRRIRYFLPKKIHWYWKPVNIGYPINSSMMIYHSL